MLIPYLGYSATKTFVLCIWSGSKFSCRMFLLRFWISIECCHKNLDVDLFAKYFSIWKSDPSLLLILCLKIWRNPVFTVVMPFNQKLNAAGWCWPNLLWSSVVQRIKGMLKSCFLLLPEPINRTVSIPLCSDKAGESKSCELASVYS